MRLHLQSIAAIAVASAGAALLVVAFKMPSAGIDPAFAVRGYLGVSLGFALLFGAFAGFEFIRRSPMSRSEPNAKGLLLRLCALDSTEQPPYRQRHE